MSVERYLYKVRLRLRSAFRRRQVEQELDDELRYHAERQIEADHAAGTRDVQAKSSAVRAVGSIARIKDECRDAWGVALLDQIRQDVQFSARTFTRSPIF